MSEKYIFNNPKWFLFQDQGTQRETSLCYEGDSIPPESLWLLTSHVYQDPPVFLRSQIPSSSLLIVRAPLMLLIGVYAPVIMLLRLRSALSLSREHSCNPAPIESLADVICYSMCFFYAASGLMMSFRNFSSSKSQPVCNTT